MTTATTLLAHDIDAVFADVCASHAQGWATICRTPTVRARGLEAELGCELYLKLETMQATGAFKERGAFAKLSSLTAEEARRGVIAASAGNHAQGVARHASLLGIAATIVMPKATPRVKIESTQLLGAEVVLEGEDFDEANQIAHARARESGAVFVHPFDDPHVAAGQGTATIELLQDLEGVDDLIVPIGGGGLCAGAALAIAKHAPHVQLYGVRSAFYPDWRPDQGQSRITPPGGVTLAEGIAVKQPGSLTASILENAMHDVILVDEKQLERALCLLLIKQNLVSEGAGAAGIAAILADPDRFKGRRVATILCGANIDPRLLSSLIMRDLARHQRLTRLRVQLLDIPGQLVDVSKCIADAGGNIIDVAYHKTFSDLPAKVTYIDLSIETQDGAQMDQVREALKAQGFIAETAPY